MSLFLSCLSKAEVLVWIKTDWSFTVGAVCIPAGERSLRARKLSPCAFQLGALELQRLPFVCSPLRGNLYRWYEAHVGQRTLGSARWAVHVGQRTLALCPSGLRLAPLLRRRSVLCPSGPASLVGHTDCACGFPPGPPLLGLRASLGQCCESGTTVRMLTESFRVFFYCGQNQVTIFIVSDRPAGLCRAGSSVPVSVGF